MRSYAAASRPFGKLKGLMVPEGLSARLTTRAELAFRKRRHTPHSKGFARFAHGWVPMAALRCVPLLLLFWALPSHAIILWNDLGATLAHETGAGSDILGGALKRDDSSSGTLY